MVVDDDFQLPKNMRYLEFIKNVNWKIETSYIYNNLSILFLFGSVAILTGILLYFSIFYITKVIFIGNSIHIILL
jgi:hypothetical protein